MVVGSDVFWSNGVWMGEREGWRVDVAACLDSRLAVAEYEDALYKWCRWMLRWFSNASGG